MFNFPLTKSSQQHKTARHSKILMKSNIVCIGSCVVFTRFWILVVFTRFPLKQRLFVETLYVS